LAWCAAVVLTGCAASVETDGENEKAKRAYDEGFKAGREIVGAEFKVKMD
jgi:hypothetical protein